MTIHKLTSRKVATAGPGKYEDGGGLRVVVSATGAKKWVLRFTINGKRREMGLGSFPDVGLAHKRVFDLVKDFGTSESPKSTRSSTTHWCPGRPGHPAFRHNIASSLRLHTGLPYDWTPRSDAPLGSPLAPSARRVSRVASRLPGTTRLRFALHGGQRMRGARPLNTGNS